MDYKIELKIRALHQRLDAFDLRVIERPSPTIDLITLQEVVASLRADITTYLR